MMISSKDMKCSSLSVMPPSAVSASLVGVRMAQSRQSGCSGMFYWALLLSVRIPLGLYGRYGTGVQDPRSQRHGSGILEPKRGGTAWVVTAVAPEGVTVLMTFLL